MKNARLDKDGLRKVNYSNKENDESHSQYTGKVINTSTVVRKMIGSGFTHGFNNGSKHSRVELENGEKRDYECPLTTTELQ